MTLHPRPLETLPRMCVSVDEACDVLSVSRDTLEKEVLPELRTLRIGRRRVIPMKELERYVELHQRCVADDLRGRV